MTDYEGYEQPSGYGQGGYDASEEDAIVTSGGGNYNLELRAVYYLHNNLCHQMAQLVDEYVAFPQTSWQVTAVEVTPFRELDKRYETNTVWGILDFADQPGGAFAFVDTHAAQILTGIAEEDLMSEEGMGYVEQWLMHLGHQFMECWQDIAQFDVQMFPSPQAPPMPELQSMFPGLNQNTPIVTTSFRVSQPGTSQTARVVLAVPQAYLLSVGDSLKAVGEMTLTTNDTTYFHERLAYVEDVPIKVTVMLGKAEMTVGDLQSLEPGDVIELNTVVGLPLEVQVGSTVLMGKPGTSADGRRLAVQIVQAMT